MENKFFAAGNISNIRYDNLVYDNSKFLTMRT